MAQEKKNQYYVMSGKRCKECGAPLKLNVVQRNPQACLCYVCFKISKGKVLTQQHKLVNGEKVLVKGIDFRKLQAENKRRYRK
jgi:hypothetical protein